MRSRWSLNDGREIHGERRNEDAFSIQIAEPGGRLHGYLKSNVRSIVRGESRAKPPAAVGSVARRHLPRHPRWPEGSRTLADLLGRLHRAASQPAETDHAAERGRLEASMDVPDRHHDARARVRGHAAAVRRRVVRDRLEQPRVGARRAHRPAVLVVSPRPAARSDLRRAGAGESRLRDARSPPVHGHARCAPARVRSIHRPHPVGHRARRLQDWLLGHAGAARARRQGDCRHLRRRISDARISRRLRSANRQAPVALQHRAESW